MNATRFLDTLDIRLTPLTPIHIGCGVDFEPTNYVISDGVLYHFDPSRVPLEPRDRQELLAAVNGGGAALRRIQRFFHERRHLYAARSHLAIPVAAGVSAQYEARIGQVAQRESGGRDVINNLEIERTAHLTGEGTPYLPGSSLKGSIRTAWLNHIDRQEPRRRSPDLGAGKEEAAGLERSLLGMHANMFETDPFRQLAVADAHGHDIAHTVCYAVDRDKVQRIDRRTGLPREKNLFVSREVILGGQFRAFAGQVRINTLNDMEKRDHRGNPMTPSRENRLPGFRGLAMACNRFYSDVLNREMAIFRERRFADVWVDRLQSMISSVREELEAGDMMLLRIGRHSGAEAVTLANHRWISVGGPGRVKRFSKAASTLWLAASRTNDRVGLLPFGWLLVEPAHAPESEPLRTWCEQQPKPDLGAVRAALVQAQAEAREAARAAAEEQSRRQAAAEAEARAREVEAAEQARRTPQQRDFHALAQALSDRVAALKGGKDRPNNQLHGQARAMARRAVAENWPAADRQALADVLEKQLPAVFQLDWRDERKKLQIAALRGSTP